MPVVPMEAGNRCRQMFRQPVSQCDFSEHGTGTRSSSQSSQHVPFKFGAFDILDELVAMLS